MLREKKCQAIVLCPAKLSFKNENEIKPFSDPKKKEKKKCITRNTLINRNYKEIGKQSQIGIHRKKNWYGGQNDVPNDVHILILRSVNILPNMAKENYGSRWNSGCHSAK